MFSYPFLLTSKEFEHMLNNHYHIHNEHLHLHGYAYIFDQIETGKRSLTMLKLFIKDIVEKENLRSTKHNFQRFLSAKCHFLGFHVIHLDRLDNIRKKKNPQLVLLLCLLYYFS